MIARPSLRSVEEITHARGAHADEHFHEVGSGDREEGNARFTRDGACDQRLARARWADEEDALRCAGADLRKTIGKT